MRALLWFFVLAATGTYICGPIVDPDLWWHITVGRWIIAHTAIPEVDHWNMFAAGEPWRAYSWWSEILFAALDSVGQYQALIAAKLVLGILLAFSFFYCFGRISGDWFFGSILGIFVTCACFDHFTLRPQTIVWIFLVWLLLALDEIFEKGSSPKRLVAVGCILMLWANTHITTIFGLALIAGWLYKEKRDIPLVGKVLLVGFLATLLTPYLGGEWLTFLSKTDHPFAHRAIAEFQPANIMQFSTGFVLIAMVLLIAFLHYRPQVLEPAKLLIVTGFVLGGLAVVKFLPVAVIILAALLARLWKSAEEDRLVLGNIAEGIEKLQQQVFRLPIEGLSFVILALVTINVYQMWQAPLADDIVPVAPVDFIEEHRLPHPVLNDFGHGGYLMYRFSDKRGVLENKVPIDGRTNVAPPEVFESFQAAYLGKVNWKEYLDKVSPQTILWRVGSPLTPLLLETGEWCLVYGDLLNESGFVVFVARQIWLDSFSSISSRNCALEPASEDQAGILS